jgi:glycosyltransferase involved in cell wall biosynthesis
MKILVYPEDNNPYQELLYGKLRQKNDIVITYLECHFLRSHVLGNILLPFRLIKYWIKNYDIFHLHWTFAFKISISNKLFQNFITRAFFLLYYLFFLKLVKLLNFKLVWTVHNLLPHDKQFNNDVWARRFLSELCDAKIVHSKSIINDMEKIGLNTKKTYINPHGNLIGVYKNNITKESAREYFGFSKKDFVFLFFGRIEPYKGVEELLEAFRQLTKKRKNIKLLIAGDCHNKSIIAKLNYYKKKLKERVEIHSFYIENYKVQHYHNCADIVVSPFRAITTSSSVILALSFGKPIICPEIGVLKDLPKSVGFFYKSCNPNELLNCMEEATINREKVKNKGEHSIVYAKKLSWNTIAEKTYGIYRDLLK